MSLNMLSNMAGITSKFFRNDIINALKKYRDLHKTEYKDALEVYYEDVVKKLKELLDKASTPTFVKFDVDHNLGLKIPVNCEKEYDMLIKLFEAVTVDEIDLDFGEANRILNNEWEWAQAASFSNTFYSSRKITKR